MDDKRQSEGVPRWLYRADTVAETEPSQDLHGFTEDLRAELWSPRVSEEQPQWATDFKKKTSMPSFLRYEIQYHFQHNVRRKGMSPGIFTDMQQRGLENPFDQWPIVVNSCDYAMRLISRDMSESGHSMELCLLTTYFLNGEIMRNYRHIRKLPIEMDISNYMQYISFNKFDPPVKTKRLSYLKAC
jgi:hypothetical protein